MEKVGTEKLPCKSGKVIDWLNGPATVVASRRFEELLESVSVALFGGAAPRPMDSPSTWRFCPRLAETKMRRVGAVTVEVMEVALAPLGVVKPVGVAMTRLVVPAVRGWNVVEPKLLLPLNTTGLVTIVPTVGMELVIETLTVSPLRTFCVDWNVSVAGFSCPETSLKLLSAENVVVEKLPEFQTKPEGVSVTVAVPLL